MKLYLAARFERQEEIQGFAIDLEKRGHEVTSSWLYYTGPDNLDKLDAEPGEVAVHAQQDMKDILAADAIICFTGIPGGTGGRHVEFGIALMTGMKVMVVGPRENIFHTLPQVEWYRNYPTFIRDGGMGYVK